MLGHRQSIRAAMLAAGAMAIAAEGLAGCGDNEGDADLVEAALEDGRELSRVVLGIEE